jgi:hypothetical protein
VYPYQDQKEEFQLKKREVMIMVMKKVEMIWQETHLQL